MHRVSEQHDVQEFINGIKDLNKGFLTNYFPDPAKIRLWLRHKLVFAEIYDETRFLFRKDKGFYHLYYCSTSEKNLQAALSALLQSLPDTLLTIDVIGNSKDLSELDAGIQSAGFFPYTSLVRMSRIISDTTIMTDTRNPNLFDAKKVDTPEIIRQLQQYFDPLAENLPLLEEFESWISMGQIIVFREEKEIQGFLIYEIIGLTSYLRYWFVHPAHREKKIGSVLIQEFFKRSIETRRQLFWVIKSNQNAIKRYLHYGFLPENLIDNIYTNNNIQYGGNNFEYTNRITSGI
jgi:ribosomal protein S18 acetylase RimI-like enzyme